MFLRLLLKIILFIRTFVSEMMRVMLRVIAPILLLGMSLTGCTGFSTSSFPSFGFGGSNSSQSPDCSEIEKRMRIAHKRYASALGKEKPAMYLSFTGNLSKTMKRNRLRGIYEMTDLHLDDVVDRTRQTCSNGSKAYASCRGANRLGNAYKPLVLAAREAHDNYCGNRPIR